MKRFSGFSLNTTLIAMAVGILIMTLMISSVWIYRYMSASIRQKFVQDYEQILDQSNLQLQNALQDVIIMSAAICTDSELIGAVNLAMNSDDLSERVENEKQAKYLLKNAAGYHPYIDNVGIYIRDRQILMNEIMSYEYQNIIPGEPWFQELMSGESAEALVSNYPLQRNYQLTGLEPYVRECCVYAVPFNDSLASSTHGILLVSLYQEYIAGFLGGESDGDGVILALIDQDNRPIYISDESAAQLLPEPDFQALSDTGGNARLGGEDYFIIRRANSMTGWSMLALIPTSFMYRDVTELVRILMQGALLTALLGIPLFALVSRRITAPFKILMESMERVGEGKMNSINRWFKIHEINLLLNRYNHMLERIELLIRQVKAVERDKMTADLAALQSQINPHFTYNTLSSINWMAKMHGATAVADMVSQFSRLLKLTTSHTGAFLRVSEEIELIKCYVDIMKFRFNSKIQVHYDIAAEAMELYTLKLILQPIIENCFIHGFCNMEQSGNIVVRAFLRDAKLYFEVKDDGVGISLDDGHLPRRVDNGGSQLHSGIGISNILDRIQMWFGAEYGLQFQSIPHNGTVVTIIQPHLPDGEFQDINPY